MNTLKTLAAAGALASTMALASGGAQAQTATSSFDGYRVVAVTAGVVVGATVAALVTDGLIIPAYYYVAAPAAGGAAAGGATAGAAGGAAAAADGIIMGGPVMHTAYETFRGGMRVLGAVAGGFYADSWYTGR